MKNFALKPVITEKSLHLASSGKFTFAVPKRVNKIIITETVATLYKVDVTDVNLVKIPGKPKGNLRGKGGMTKAKVKAIVTLKKGQTIPGFEITTHEDHDHNHDHDHKHEKKAKKETAK